MNRSIRRLAYLIGAGVAAALIASCGGDDDNDEGPTAGAAAVPQDVTTVKNGLYVITGALDNTTVVVGSDSLIVIDDQFAPRYQSIADKIRTLSDKPVRYLINTHFHGDHTGGNVQFRQHGAEIVAHANVGARLSNPPPIDPVSGQPNAPAPADALPTVSYGGTTAFVGIGGVTAELVHPATPAHTDGDTIVILQAANVIASGDIVGNHYPNIDLSVGGGIDGMIAGVDLIIGRMDNDTKVIPGHGPVLSKADVVAYRGMLQTARDRIAKAKASGMSESQVVAANLLADLDNPWKSAGPGAAVSAQFPGNVYRSLP